MATITETFGDFLLVIGFVFRPVTIMLVFTTIVAALHHLKNGDGIGGASHTIELGILFLSLVLIGPGKYSADRKHVNFALNQKRRLAKLQGAFFIWNKISILD